jgi:hypothetical protein
MGTTPGGIALHHFSLIQKAVYSRERSRNGKISIKKNGWISFVIAFALPPTRATKKS